MDEIYYTASEIADMLKLNIDTIRYRIKILGIECCYIGKSKYNQNNSKFYSMEQIEMIKNWKMYIDKEFQIFESKMNY